MFDVPSTPCCFSLSTATQQPPSRLASCPGTPTPHSPSPNTAAHARVLLQWDMSRAVPRCTATVSLEKGDILALVARKDRVYAANADGSIRCGLGPVRGCAYACARVCLRMGV